MNTEYSDYLDSLEDLESAEAAYEQMKEDGTLAEWPVSSGHAELVAALLSILVAEDEFRASLPKDWDGDPLHDACVNARAVLRKVGAL